MIPRLLAIAALFALSCTVQLKDDHFFNPGPVEQQDETAKWQLPEGYTAADVMLPMADGVRLHAVRISGPSPRAEVLYLGGNAFRTETSGAPIAAALAGQKVNALILDYRGYGRSEGKPTIELLQSDSLAAYDWLRAQTTLPIVVHGLSLGGFMAAHVAAERHPEGLVLESTATNTADWADTQAPFFIRVQIADKLREQDNIARLKEYRGPLLIVAGDKDKVTPVKLSQKLFEEAASPDKELVIVPGGNHGDSFEKPEALAKFRAFILKINS
jgi:uncharacterized protein